jgi:hypothetical protein
VLNFACSTHLFAPLLFAAFTSTTGTNDKSKHKSILRLSLEAIEDHYLIRS